MLIFYRTSFPQIHLFHTLVSTTNNLPLPPTKLIALSLILSLLGLMSIQGLLPTPIELSSACLASVSQKQKHFYPLSKDKHVAKLPYTKYFFLWSNTRFESSCISFLGLWNQIRPQLPGSQPHKQTSAHVILSIDPKLWPATGCKAKVVAKSSFHAGFPSLMDIMSVVLFPQLEIQTDDIHAYMFTYGTLTFENLNSKSVLIY